MMDKRIIEKVYDLLNTPFSEELSLLGEPATDEEIVMAENELGVAFHDDYKKFIKTFGGTTIGVEVYAFHNNEMMSKDTVVDLTKSFRIDYEDDYRKSIIDDSYVFSMDGMGNPIMSDRQERVIIFYHDSDEYEVLTDSFSKFVEWLVDGKGLYDFNG
ncbi:SMI1/KNR4 family protein [Marinobacter zhejiangensis]|uniref:SMI1-KNR4 cell-wall n=1 Tax=Marinobacter zhejiangensis TaxID=488535 RepID=A0A1I4NCP2_9GAMM|nr:SMI1/KNR4 family protein [Marinobacter zhejiangensis]SFM13342.1 SMI1-KNR4 cell-wall [Marinobacter zhejiangensis]